MTTNTPYLPHVLTLIDTDCADCGALHVCPACKEDGPEQEWSIACPGVSDDCRGFAECPVCYAQMTPELDEALYESGEAHGKEHRRLNGAWMVPTSRCYLHIADSTAEAVEDLKPLAAGSYPVSFDVEDDEFVILALIEPAGAVS